MAAEEATPTVALGCDSPLSLNKAERDRSTTVENFFLRSSNEATRGGETGQSAAPLESQKLDKLDAEPRHFSPYTLNLGSSHYSLLKAAEVCQKIIVQNDGPRQDGSSDLKSVAQLLISDPVACGFMEKYARRTYCAENLGVSHARSFPPFSKTAHFSIS